jgi:hypothetical protein
VPRAPAGFFYSLAAFSPAVQAQLRQPVIRLRPAHTHVPRHLVVRAANSEAAAQRRTAFSLTTFKYLCSNGYKLMSADLQGAAGVLVSRHLPLRRIRRTL